MTREEFLKTFPGFLPDYKPSVESLQKIQSVCLLIIIGPSGVGKTALINRLGLHYVPSDTTRLPRPGEKHGQDMFFVTDYDEILDDIKKGRFLQFVVGASGDFYSTRASSFPGDGWAVMPVLADVVSYFRQLGFKRTLSTFITPPSYEEWMRRMDTHGLSDEQLHKRLAEAKRSFEFVLGDERTYFIFNDNLDEAVEQVRDLFEGKVHNQREAIARGVARQIYQELSEA